MNTFLIISETALIRPLKRSSTEVSHPEFRFMPGLISSLSALSRDTAVSVMFLTSAQAEESAVPRAAIELLADTLSDEGITLANPLLISTHQADSLHALLKERQDDVNRNYFIVSEDEHCEFAKRLACPFIHLSAVSEEARAGALSKANSWNEILCFLLSRTHFAKFSRNTKETSISAEVYLWGKGQCEIRSGIGFFDHMLNLLGAHAGFDLSIQASGDLWVDEHHLIEDVGIVLGEAISRALGERKGISRYGFLLPMDEALAQVAIDLAARSHLEWQAEFKREKIGEMPTEMFKHFFKSFAESLRCSLHISVSGENEHHKIEAIFKGVGRALRLAVNRDRLAQGVPSTKGVL